MFGVGVIVVVGVGVRLGSSGVLVSVRPHTSVYQ